jgi:hypothetical protein
MTDVSSIESAGEIKPHDIAFAELDHDKATNPVGLIPFEDWAKTKPDQKKFLSPFPDYVEPTVVKPIEGVEKTIREKLLMYVAEARFAVARPPQSIHLARYATSNFFSRLDPSSTGRSPPPRWTTTRTRLRPGNGAAPIRRLPACGRPIVLRASCRSPSSSSTS